MFTISADRAASYTDWRQKKAPIGKERGLCLKLSFL